jgi:hypothetical protein
VICYGEENAEPRKRRDGAGCTTPINREQTANIEKKTGQAVEHPTPKWFHRFRGNGLLQTVATIFEISFLPLFVAC